MFTMNFRGILIQYTSTLIKNLIVIWFNIEICSHNGARRSSVVEHSRGKTKAFAHGAMVRRINPSLWTY